MSRSTVVMFAAAVVLSTPIAAQNLAVNAEFDDNVASWTLREGTDLFWSSIDRQGCGGSGSALASSQELLNSPLTVHVLGVIQCLDLAVSGQLSLGMVRDASVSTSIFLSFHATGACGDDNPTVVSAPLGPTTGWEPGELSDVDVPVGTQSVRFGIESLQTTPFSVSLDGVYLSSARPIFLDGFDGDLSDETMPCRWSASVP